MQFAEPLDESIAHAVESVMKQTSKTFVNCFQIFYPTSILKWECLSNFMNLYFEEPQKYARMLSAILEALCHCRGHLLGVFPILSRISRDSFENSIVSLLFGVVIEILNKKFTTVHVHYFVNYSIC